MAYVEDQLIKNCELGGTSASLERRETMLDELNNSLVEITEFLDATANRLHSIADRMIGGVPITGTDGEDLPIQEGLIASLNVRRDRLQAIATKLGNAADRLEQVA